MSHNKATYIVLILLIMVGVLYSVSANQLSGTSTSDAIGPRYFPNLLAGTLILFCIISFIKTLVSREDTKIELPGLKMILLTIAIIGIFLVSASSFGWFYFQVFVFLMVLLTLYRSSLGLNIRILSINATIALVVTIIIYIVFDTIMTIRF